VIVSKYYIILQTLGDS